MGTKKTTSENEEHRGLEEQTHALLHRVGKAMTLPGQKPAPASNAMQSEEEMGAAFTMAGGMMPPYDPVQLLRVFEHGSALRSNVDGYVTNIDAFGHRLEPLLKIESVKSKQAIGDAIYLDKLARDYDGGIPPAVQYPNETEIDAKRKEWEIIMRIERAILDRFFENCHLEGSFVELRQQVRYDLEITGNGYWEVIRDTTGKPAQLVYLPAYSMRLMMQEPRPVRVMVRERVAIGSFQQIQRQRRFRRFVQIVQGQTTYFKEFGDDRVMDADTGIYVPTEEQAKWSGRRATEVMHFRVFSSRSSYGIPRWIASLLSVLGSRASEEVNYLYFDNKSIPPLAVLVAGGHLRKEAKEKLESFIRDHIKGRENFHKILVLEAEAATGGTQGMADAGRIRITLQPLTQAQQQDALFQNYDERNIDKLGTSFRLPRLLRGDVRDFNRATAEAALEFAEMQVFQPERERFDAMLNRLLLPALGIRFWEVRSQGPAVRNHDALRQLIKDLVEANVMTIEEARQVANDVLPIELRPLESEWTKQPMAMTLAGIMGDYGLAGMGAVEPPAATKGTPSPEQARLAQVAANLKTLRDTLMGEANKEQNVLFAERQGRENTEQEVERVTIPRELMDELVEPSKDDEDEPAAAE